MKDMGASRFKLNIVSRTDPRIGLVGEQIVNAKALVRLESKLGKDEIDPSSLRVLMVEIHDNENHIFLFGVRLAVADEKGLVGRMKAQGAIAVQRRMHPTNFIDARDERLQVLRLFNVPVTELIFF